MIRQVRFEELGELHTLFSENILNAWSHTSVEEHYKSSPESFMGFFEDDKLIGYAIFSKTYDECEILSIAVSSASRRQGIGRLLLQEIILTSKKTGVKRLFLEVRSQNSTAQSFYLHMGFVPIGRRKSYYKNPLDDAVIMRLDL